MPEVYHLCRNKAQNYSPEQPFFTLNKSAVGVSGVPNEGAD